jgi:hypothetical protein
MCQFVTVQKNSPLFQEIIMLCPPKKITRDFTLVYAGQVPNVCVFLISGKILRVIKNKSLLIQGQGFLGGSEVLKKNPSSATIVIKKNAFISIFDRQSLISGYLTLSHYRAELKLILEFDDALNA